LILIVATKISTSFEFNFEILFCAVTGTNFIFSGEFLSNIFCAIAYEISISKPAKLPFLS